MESILKQKQHHFLFPGGMHKPDGIFLFFKWPDILNIFAVFVVIFFEMSCQIKD